MLPPRQGAKQLQLAGGSQRVLTPSYLHDQAKVGDILEVSAPAGDFVLIAAVGHQLDNFTSYTWYEHMDPGDTRSRQGHMDLSDIPLPDDVHVFTTGPLEFIRHIRTELMQLGVPAHYIRYEVFGPDLWVAQAGRVGTPVGGGIAGLV